MAYISENTVNKIKDRLTIVEVIKDFVKLKKSGRNWTGLCPFHIEKTPSFFVNEEKGIYHCFGCSASGNIFNFIMRIENVSFPESIKILAQKAGISIEYKNGEFTEQHKQQELIYKINERASFIYNYYLMNKPEGEKAKKYLKERKITHETINDFKLGFAPDHYEKLHEELLKENYNDKTMGEAGLIIKSNNSNKYYDRFRNRLIFPIVNVLNNVIGFGGRIMSDTTGVAKYINTPETEVYSKRYNLYAINMTHNFIREKRQAVIVEGYFDAIALYQEGIKNVVALLGTSLTNEQILLLQRYADEIILLFDSDKAGNAATIKSISALLNTNLKIKIVEMPSGYDPDDYIFKLGKDNLLKLIQSAPSFLKFIVLTAFKKYNSHSVDGKNKILNFIFPIIIQIHNEVLKSEVFRVLANRLKVDEHVLKSEFRKFTLTGKAVLKKLIQESDIPNSILYSEKFIIMSMVERPELVDKILPLIKLNYFTWPLTKQLFHVVQEYYKKNNRIDINEILEMILDPKVKEMFVKEILSEKYSKNLLSQLNDCILKIRLNRIEKIISIYNSKLKKMTDFKHINKIEETIHRVLLEKKRLLENKNKIIQ